MNPKEKAKWLVAKLTQSNKGNKNFNSKYCNGIRASSIAVEEIIQSIIEVERELNSEDISAEQQYWTEVKQEIEKL